MLSYNHRIAILAFVPILAVVAMFFVDPIPQDPGYHSFADSRPIGGISNFWNVLSNLPFLVVGIFGFYRYPRLSHRESTPGYLVMCAGVVLVSVGSSWYHLSPSNETLLWDRLPMTVAFMALVSLLLGERVIHKPAPGLLWLLVFAGAASAVYWAWTESLGRGDLRPYALVQFVPVLLTPLVLVLFPERYLSNRLLLAAFALYFAAKLLEHFDGQVLAATGVMSGHAFKHVAAAGAALCIIYAVPAKAGSISPGLG